MTVGVICEYNPLHLGHQKQLRQIRETFGADTVIVCAMSGNYVQRGFPALIDKSCRAKAAVISGADLVLELPVTTALSSAEGFAAGGVRILSDLCEVLCFGAETAEPRGLMETAEALHSQKFSMLLRENLETGCSFPAARQKALEQMGLKGGLLSQPNDILGVEYCKAILAQGSAMQPFPIHRPGSYHAREADAENPSATAVRRLMLEHGDWEGFVPESAASLFAGAALHTLAAGERAVLGKLRTMTESDFEALPYGSEGLWRKCMYASRREASLDDVAAAIKSKRYTRSRIDRMLMCAFLGITEEMMAAEAPYIRVLAFTDRGRGILKQAKKHGGFRNAGEAAEHPYWELEKRCGDLYGLFCTEGTEMPGMEEKRRIYYHTA